MSAPMPEPSCAGRHGTAMRAPLGVCPYGAVVLLASLLYDAPCGGLPPATALASALRWCPCRSSLVPSSLYAACATGPIGRRVSSSPRLPTVPSTTASVAPIVWMWILPVVTPASFACDPFVAWSIPGPIAASWCSCTHKQQCARQLLLVPPYHTHCTGPHQDHSIAAHPSQRGIRYSAGPAALHRRLQSLRRTRLTPCITILARPFSTFVAPSRQSRSNTPGSPPAHVHPTRGSVPRFVLHCPPCHTM